MTTAGGLVFLEGGWFFLLGARFFASGGTTDTRMVDPERMQKGDAVIKVAVLLSSLILGLVGCQDGEVESFHEVSFRDQGGAVIHSYDLTAFPSLGSERMCGSMDQDGGFGITLIWPEEVVERPGQFSTSRFTGELGVFVTRPLDGTWFQQRADQGSIVFHEVDSDLDGDRVFAGEFGVGINDDDGVAIFGAQGSFVCRFPTYAQ